MATGEPTQDSLTSVLFGFTKDALSSWVDLKRQEGQATVAQRIIDAQGQQARLSNTTPVNYQNRGGAYDVRSSSAAMAGLPPWLMWIGAGLLIFGAGVAVVRVAKG